MRKATKEKGPTSASEEAAASAAAHKVLTTLLPTDAATFNQLHQTILAGIRDNARKRRGLEWGDSVAEKILDWRENDGSTASREPPGSNEPGDWQPTPPPPTVKEPLPYAFPQWGFVTPFAMPTSSFFRPNGPPALGSARYAADYNEVKAIGEDDSTVRTDEQTDVALFWADGTGTVTPPGHWNVIAKDVAARINKHLRQNARLFALLNVAMADAAIAAWDAKYAYNFWRPVTAIRAGEMDGNPATEPDEGWLPLIVTPHFRTTSRATVHSAARPRRSCLFSMERPEFRFPPHWVACPTLNVETLVASCKRLARQRSAPNVRRNPFQVCERRWFSGWLGDRSMDIQEDHGKVTARTL